jgi:hypothetical protein
MLDIITMNEYINGKKPPLLRGGTFCSPPASVRSALRIGDAPATRTANLCFRPSRTYP